MSNLDKNKIFFGLLHYIFSEQNNVNWAFKTSLVNFTGINTTIDNQKYKKSDLTDSIIDYIYDVKPYHVQFEQYIEKYSSQQDDIDVDINENNHIDVNIRFDAVTSDVTPQNDMNDLEYMDTHMANRLYKVKTQDKDIIKDYLNCHFKGISVNGSNLNLDKSGYDAFLYDSTLYDYPTITSEYCLVDFNELYNYPFEKKFIKIGSNTFIINTEKELSKSNLSIIRENGNNKEEIFDYSIDKNTITLFNGIKKYEKITIYYNQENDNKRAFIYVGHPFIECNDKNNLKQFVNYTKKSFKIPETGISNIKIAVYIEDKNGNRYPTNGYDIEDGYINVYDIRLQENCIIMINVIDYEFIYDKIYNWEDLYGQSNNVTSWESYYQNINNIQNLDGNKLLRPYYDKERPSELCVSQPISYLMIYNLTKSNKVSSVYNVDYKNKQFNLPLSIKNKLMNEVKIGDKEIHLQDATKINLPYNKNDKLYPGKIIVNNEIIAFYDYEKLNDGSIKLKKISRGFGGSYLNNIISQSSDVYAYIDNSEDIKRLNNLSISYQVKNHQNHFIISGEINNTDKIEVYKKPIIRLLSDINLDSKNFLISSDNIQLPLNDKKGEIIINNDKIYFSQIEKLNDSYIISGFDIDKEYKKNDSYILSKNYELVSKNEYNILEEDYNQGDNEEYSKTKKYIVFNNAPLDNEIITIINRT